jgi:hypothetical protein
MATVALSSPPVVKPSRSAAGGWLGIYSATTVWQSVLAVAVLPLHVFSPNIGLLARAVVQAPITWSARFESLMPLLLTSLSWLSFQSTSLEGAFVGLNVDAVTGLEGYAYIFGVALMILRYTVFRAGYPQLAGRRILDRRFVILGLLLIFTLISAYRGAVQGERGWSSPFRAALTAGGFFYGVVIAQSYSSKVKLLTGFWVPAGLLFYGLSAIGHLNHRLIWTLAPFVSGAATYVVIKQPFTSAGVVALVTLAVSGWRCVLGPFSSGTLLLLWISGALASVFATRQVLGLGRAFRRPVVVLLAMAMTFATLYVAFNKETLQAEAVTREESLSDYLWWKLIEDRGLIWSQAMVSFLERPLTETLFVPGGQSLTLRYGGRYHDVKIGLHNAYLDAIYYFGWVPGGVLCLFIVLLCGDCIRALGRKLPIDIEIMAFGVLINAIVGGFSGQYFIHQEGGTWFYLPAGIVAGYYLRERQYSFASSVAGVVGRR